MWSPAASLTLGLGNSLCSSPEAYWTPSDLGDSSFGVISFWPFIQFMRFSRQVYWDGLPFPPPVISFCRDSGTTMWNLSVRRSWIQIGLRADETNHAHPSRRLNSFYYYLWKRYLRFLFFLNKSSSKSPTPFLTYELQKARGDKGSGRKVAGALASQKHGSNVSSSLDHLL